MCRRPRIGRVARKVQRGVQLAGVVGEPALKSPPYNSFNSAARASASVRWPTPSLPYAFAI